MLLCEICKQEFKNVNSLGNHISRSHKDSSTKEYYLKYIEPGANICKVCGKPDNKFKSLSRGFFNNCSYKCSQLNSDTRDKIKKTNLEKYGVENAMQLDEFKDKIKKTNLERYGVEHSHQSEEIRNKYKDTMLNKYGTVNPMEIEGAKDKIKKTNLEKYGVEHAMQSDVVKNNTKKTNLERYGVEYPLQLKDVQNKIEQTNLKKYGVKRVSQTQECIDKMLNTRIKKYGSTNLFFSIFINNKRKKTNLEKYGVEHHLSSDDVRQKYKNTIRAIYKVDNISQNPDIKAKINNTMLKRYGHTHFISSDIGKEKIKNTIFNRLLNSNRLKDKVVPLFDLKEYNGISRENRYKFKCKKCDNIFEDNIADGKVPRCFNCYPIENNNGVSKLEKEIVEYIRELLPNDIINENTRSVIPPLELDIYIPSHNLAIEFNGLYWHSEAQGKDKKYHLNKTNLCRDKNIQLIHIFEDEWINKQEIIKSMIKNKLKLSDTKIFARKCNIVQLKNREVYDFLNDNHIQGFVFGKQYGLLYENEIVALLTMSKPRFNKNYNWEILRYCNKLNTNVIGGFSKLLRHFENEHLGGIITYADLRYSTGNLYKQNGFINSHTSKPNYFYIKDGIERLPRYNFQKHKLNVALESFDPSLTEKENMTLNNYGVIWDCGNLVFTKG